MTTAIILLAILAAVTYALQRNHARQTTLWSSLYGSTTADDRDAERVRADLAAIPTSSDTQSPRPAQHHAAQRTGHRPRAA